MFLSTFMLAAAAPAAADPVVAVLDAARGACSFEARGEAFHTGLAAKGWEAFTPEPGSKLEPLLRPVSRMGVVSTPRAYRRTVGGHGLVAIIGDVQVAMGGSTKAGLSCAVIDQDMRAAPDTRLLRSWSGRSVDMDSDEDGTYAVWEPGLGHGDHETRIVFQSAEAAAREGHAPVLSYSANSDMQ